MKQNITKKHINIALEDFLNKDYGLLSLDYDITVDDNLNVTSLIYISGFYINDDMAVVEIIVTYHIKNDEIFFKKINKKIKNR